MSDSIDSTLEARGKNYGDFSGHALLAQCLKDAMRSAVPDGWDRLSLAQRESLDMVQHKIARIINGDTNFHDSWYDCIGYLRLIEKDLSPTPPQKAAEKSKRAR